MADDKDLKKWEFINSKRLT